MTAAVNPPPGTEQVHLFVHGPTRFRACVRYFAQDIALTCAMWGPPLPPDQLPEFVRWMAEIMAPLDSDPRNKVIHEVQPMFNPKEFSHGK